MDFVTATTNAIGNIYSQKRHLNPTKMYNNVFAGAAAIAQGKLRG